MDNTDLPVLVPVVISGGAGTRLWPVSRETFPKPMMTLADGESLLQKTFNRVAALPGVREVVTVINREIYFLARDILARSEARAMPCSFLLEPVGRNTAAAIAAAASWVARRHGDHALMLVLPADHLIEPLESFVEAVAAAAQVARQGWLATFGVAPTAPETGYGYIQAGPPIGMAGELAHLACRFVEKPALELARTYLASGDYLWNSGMFCFSAGAVLAELQRYAADIADQAAGSVRSGRELRAGDQLSLELDPAAFEAVRAQSLDFALMERSQRVAVVRNTMRWSDVGSWSSVSALLPQDGDGNSVSADAVLHNTRRCYIRSERVVGAVGLDNLMIVDTEDALLVAHREHAEDVRHIVTALQRKGHDACRHHRTVRRPWGAYSVLVEGERFKVKRIVVAPGQSLSLQLHAHRYEHWIVVSGEALVENGTQRARLLANQSTYIPAGQKHRLHNPGSGELVLIEVQCGNYLGEDDIVRFEDNYGRAPAQAGTAQASVRHA